MPTSKRRPAAVNRKNLLDPDLRVFSGESLSAISMPLGGIGTGCVGLGGRGQLRDWEIFGAPNQGFAPEYTLPFIHCRCGRETVTRVLESRLLPPYTSAHGLSPGVLAGMPRLEGAVFEPAYPFGRITFIDDALAVAVELEAFNPMIPNEADDSALPVAILTYTVSNPTRTRVSGTIAWSLQNCVGLSAKPEKAGDEPSGLGQNLNEYRSDDLCQGLFMTSRKYGPEQLGFGSMALLAPRGEDARATVATGWLEEGWWDRAQRIWDDFAADGRLDGPTTSTPPSADKRTHVGTLGLSFDLAPGATAKLTFVIAWHFPWRVMPSMYKGHKPPLVRNHYAGRFPGAWSAGRYAVEHLDRLRLASRTLADSLYSSTLPGHVLEAVGTQMSILKTNTVLWLDSPADEPGGRIFAYEGCSDKEGCCPMNCTHVWNYEQTLAHLYPALERTMRRTDFLDNVRPQGAMSFRTVLPLHVAGQQPWGGPAADGQFGTVVKLYRDWQLSGDAELLRQLYPAVKESIDFAQKGTPAWDADGDGVLEGVQHNTYDIDFHGPNTMVGSLYLSALRAGAKMAKAVGDDDSALRWELLEQKAATKYDRELFRGGYYVQRVPEIPQEYKDLLGNRIPAGRPKYQYGAGCLSDQLLGQWAAHVAGLGYVLPKAHVRGAIGAVFRHNFRPDLCEHESVQRTYALNDEGGLLLCTWPKGQRERFPFPYSDEVWTGIEYQVAAHLIYEGFIDEGLAIVLAIRRRHDGLRRNPFDEPECGHFYARALASWSVLLALTGQGYSAVERRLTVRPVLNQRQFKCLVTLGEGWGVFTQRLTGRTFTVSLELLGGKAELQHVEISWPGGKPPGKLTATTARSGQAMPARLARNGAELTLSLDAPATLKADDVLRVQVR